MRTSNAEARSIVEATQAYLREGIESCMKEAGYPLEMASQKGAEEGILNAILSRPKDVETAIAVGFNIAVPMRNVKPRQPEDDRIAGRPDPWNEYVMGLSESERGLIDEMSELCTLNMTGPLKQGPGTVSSILADSYSSVIMQEDWMRDAQAAWSRCMSGKGIEASAAADVRVALRPLIEAAYGSIADDGTFGSDALDALWESEQNSATAVAECDVEAFAPILDEWSDAESRWADENAELVSQLDDQLKLSWASTIGL